MRLRWPWQLRPHNIWHGIKNIFRWLPIVWFDRDWDWTFLGEIMEYKLRRMADVELHGHHVTSLRDRKHQLICAELLRRMMADNYFDNAGYDPSIWPDLPAHRQVWIAKHSNEMAKQDQRYLGMMLGKYLMNWWD